MAPRARWSALLLLACCVVLLAAHAGAAAPLQPEYPGDDAPAEELQRFYNELQQYLHVLTRHRYGKRSGARVLCEEPYGAAGC